jgi:hypothetical protein
MQEMLAMFFIHANKVTEVAIGKHIIRKKQSQSMGQEWRLKNHAHAKFYEWLSSWAMSLRKPSDLGYDDNGYVLPQLNIMPLYANVDYVPDGQLFFTGLHGIQDRVKIRRITAQDRINSAIELIVKSKE